MGVSCNRDVGGSSPPRSVPSGKKSSDVIKMKCKYLSERIARSEAIVAERKKESEDYSNSEKAYIFEGRLKENAICGRIVPRVFSSPASLWTTEHTIYSMIASVFKYATNRDAESFSQLEQSVDSIRKLDKVSGDRGFLPKAVIKNGSDLACFKETVTTNLYSQALFAYYAANKVLDDGELKDKVKYHSAQLLNIFPECNFDLMDEKGMVDFRRGSLNVPFFSLNGSRRLDSLCLEAAGRSILGEQKVVDSFKKFNDNKGYWNRNYKLSFKVGCFEWPTYSTHFLNFMRLSVLGPSGNKKFSDLFDKHYSEHVEDGNPFFDSLYAVFGNSDSLNVSDLVNRNDEVLSTYPVNPDDSEILNSPNWDGKTRFRFIKPSSSRVFGKKYTPESKNPIPIFSRPLFGIQWKENPFSLDGNFGRNGKRAFLGTDFLMAYWMNEFVKKSNSL